MLSTGVVGPVTAKAAEDDDIVDLTKDRPWPAESVLYSAAAYVNCGACRTSESFSTARMSFMRADISGSITATSLSTENR